MSYGYDNDSRLTSITYQYGSTTLGNLSYAHDQLGRRTQVIGSFARTGLPGAVSSTSYDAANELTNWNGITLSYDQNGNMLADGDHTLTWDARSQVSSVNGIGLQYDAFGRRSTNLFGTSFLFDGPNAVQEFSGGTVTDNSITGDVDETFNRSDSSGTFMPLRDGLGSTIALVNSSGSVTTSYSFDPFGNTSFSGAGSTNPFQYAGRENELDGLYYYRARYYDPLLGRFVSEDPIGFAGGMNKYAYVDDSATNDSDPFELIRHHPMCASWGCSSDAGGNQHAVPAYGTMASGVGPVGQSVSVTKTGHVYWVPVTLGNPGNSCFTLPLASFHLRLIRTSLLQARV